MNPPTLQESSPAPRVDLEAIVELCHDLLDRIHRSSVGTHLVEHTLYNIVLLKLFGYSLNTFKAIYYLLPHTVYEQASTLYRTLWETAINLEWIAIDPEARADRFLRFTAVEQVRFLEARIRTARRAGNADAVLLFTRQLGEFERLLDEQLSEFAVAGKKARRRHRDRFSAPTLRDVVNEVGGEWLDEYDRDYQLACGYTHGAPGAVLFPLYDTHDHQIDRVRSVERSGIVGASAIAVMSRTYRRWLAARGKSDDEYLRDLETRVRSTGRQ